MLRSKINNSTYAIIVPISGNAKLELSVAKATADFGKMQKKKIIQEAIMSGFTEVFSANKYQDRYLDFDLVSPEVIKQVVHSDEILPDGYTQVDDEGLLVPSYNYEGLISFALETGLLQKRERERVDEVVRQKVVRETYYIIPGTEPEEEIGATETAGKITYEDDGAPSDIPIEGEADEVTY